ncbi:glycosyltransferase family 92 protein [Leclercia sp. Marseille-Q4284]|uniref:glycosyltransferase family 92 protein n=1 Tax=Leclercia sp. Marseille-Q4284 TaxID=2866582 RepID=UPI001CE3F5E1|nr:glycosyltransferase family 92 protein [Leclercia sp. Marseille-Q4284]
MKLYIAAIIKDEVKSLLEWIAYHKVLGADGFIIADNDSKDGSRELLNALSHIENIIVIDYPTITGQKPQLPAYSKILNICPSEVDLLAFIDADEFLMPLGSGLSMKEFVAQRFADDSVSAVALNWANFGSNNQMFAEDKLVTERFTRRAPQRFNVHRNFKSIVRPAQVQHFLNPHFAELRSGRYVDALGRDLVSHPKHGNGVSAEILWEGARVNHYAVKSLEEFLLGKHLRGSAATAKRVKHKAYFIAHDRNDEECHLAAEMVPAIKIEMERLTTQLDSIQISSSSPHSLIKRLHRWLRKRKD